MGQIGSNMGQNRGFMRFIRFTDQDLLTFFWEMIKTKGGEDRR